MSVAIRTRKSATGEAPRGRLLAAAGAILARDGYNGLTMERVAAESGVAKTTLYRHWPTKAALCMDLYLAQAARELHDPDTGRVADDLRHVVNTVVRLQTRTVAGPALVGLIAEAQIDPSTRQVKVADQYGEVSRQPAWQEPLVLRLDLGRADALSDSGNYYVRVLATLGTVAEKESERAGNAVFGDDDSTVSLAGMGKMLFHAVLSVNDYLQSVSAESRTRNVSGREMKAAIKLQ